MSSIRLKIAVGVALYLSLGLSMLFGQANVGGIFGHVSDTSGGAVVGATLTLGEPGYKRTSHCANRRSWRLHVQPCPASELQHLCRVQGLQDGCQR